MTSLASLQTDRPWTAARMAAARVAAARVAVVAVLVLIGGVQSPAAPPWTSLIQEGRFVFRADFPLEQVADDLACVSPTTAEVARLVGMAPHREPVAFYLFADEAALRRYLAQRLPNAPYRRSLYVQGSGYPMVFAQRSSALATDLRHESTHAALHALWTAVPLWLDEGMAEYCEIAPPSRLRGHPWFVQVAADARHGRLPQLEILEGKSRADALVDADYRAAWAWVHFLLNGPTEARDEFRRYCTAWNLYDTARRRDPPNAVVARSPKTADAADRTAAAARNRGAGVGPRAAGDAAGRPGAVEPEPLSKRLTRRIPDLDRQFLRHFVGQ